ncbi:prepilin-type N-terminal cleavage/methylation domain-containing protein [Shewanella psychrophila]|uniref:Prepilin-type N-terminal cleavage/methylation domain-containing protein n=1 Tax=Shewanella psychrophila TaxID=225848 RepID=A0A1S6HY23_9GAMM|nr:type II secretion system protein [Shewanella psychrophila]AQS40411.1 prepilin-type N-terminal cleavage/methylation domain-containing protein [Shewanella psychrophila]
MQSLKGIRSSGFTLVEMVMVIIILGVLVLGVSSFLILGTRIFVESTSVDQVLSQSRFVMERMTREIRNSVPNSLRVTITNNASTFQCIEFVPIQASASYLDIPIAPAASTLSGTVMTPSQGINTAHRMLVYPLQPEHIYSATPTGAQGHLLDITSFVPNIVPNTGTVTFDRLVRFSEASPRSRYFLVDDAVSYCFFVNGDIRRYQGYNMFNATQPTPVQMGGDASSALMAENVVINGAWPIFYTPGTLANSAVVQLAPQFEVNDQAFQYQHQVQVVNVP